VRLVLSFLFCLAALGAAAAEPRLPAIEADSLAKDTLMLPEALATDPALVTFSFSQDQIDAVETLEDTIPVLKTGRTGLAAYNMPVIPNPGAIVRSFIRSGMRGVYETPEDRRRTVVLFVDEDTFFDQAGFPSMEEPLIALVARDGRLLDWIPASAADPEAINTMLENAGL